MRNDFRTRIRRVRRVRQRGNLSAQRSPHRLSTQLPNLPRPGRQRHRRRRARHSARFQPQRRRLDQVFQRNARRIAERNPAPASRRASAFDHLDEPGRNQNRRNVSGQSESANGNPVNCHSWVTSRQKVAGQEWLVFLLACRKRLSKAVFYRLISSVAGSFSAFFRMS